MFFLRRPSGTKDPNGKRKPNKTPTGVEFWWAMV